MKIFLGTDHAGFELKEEIKKFLNERGHEVVDCGAVEFDPNDDYPDFCAEAARGVSANEGSIGFVFGKSGAGEAITANKFKGIRAVLAVDEGNVKLAREHNDANVLSLGARFYTNETAKNLVKLFIDTPFSNEERHKRRIEKIKSIESNS
jgi:ribose 5-phosphate isomerase B